MLKAVSIGLFLSTLIVSGLFAEITQAKRDMQVVIEYGNKEVTINDIRNHLEKDTLSLKEIATMEEKKLKKIVKELIKQEYMRRRAFNTDIVKTEAYKRKLRQRKKVLALYMYQFKHGMTAEIYEVYKRNKKDYEKEALREAYDYDEMKSDIYFERLERFKRWLALDLTLEKIDVTTDEMVEKYYEVAKEKAEFETYQIIVGNKNKALKIIQVLNRCKENKNCKLFEKFKMLVKQYTEFADSKKFDGYKGSISCKEGSYMPKEFCEVLPKMDEDDYTKRPIKHNGDYYILYIKTIWGIPFDEEFRHEIRRRVQKEKYFSTMKNEFEQYYNKLKIYYMF